MVVSSHYIIGAISMVCMGSSLPLANSPIVIVLAHEE